MKKTIVDKNGITRIVWVKRDSSKNPDKKKARSEDKKKDAQFDQRNYKTIPTKDLIEEAKGLKVSWKENKDLRINRMRVIMALKKYYSENSINSEVAKFPTQTKPDYMSEKEYKKFGKRTEELIQKARKIGILGEDEETHKFLDMVKEYNKETQEFSVNMIDFIRKFGDTKLAYFFDVMCRQYYINTTLYNFFPKAGDYTDGSIGLEEYYKSQGKIGEKSLKMYNELLKATDKNVRFLALPRILSWLTGEYRGTSEELFLKNVGDQAGYASLVSLHKKYGNSLSSYVIGNLMNGDNDISDTIRPIEDFSRRRREAIASAISDLRELINKPKLTKKMYVSNPFLKENEVKEFLNSSIEDLEKLRETLKEYEKLIPQNLASIKITKDYGVVLLDKNNNEIKNSKFNELIQDCTDTIAQVKKGYDKVGQYNMVHPTDLQKKYAQFQEFFYSEVCSNFEEMLNIYNKLDPELTKTQKYYNFDYIKKMSKSLEKNGYSNEITAYLAVRSEASDENRDILCCMKAVSKEIYEQIANRISDEYDNVHHRFKYKIHGIYEVNNLDVEKNYEEVLNSRKDMNKAKTIGGKNAYQDTFYHGTSFGSFEKILGVSGKFKTPKNSSNVNTGAMMGYGVYLADKSSKSMQYCGDTYGRRNKRGTLMICEASLGDEAINFKNYKGKNPDNKVVYAVPDGKNGLLNLEWCVPNDDAVLPKYVIDIELL